MVWKLIIQHEVVQNFIGLNFPFEDKDGGLGLPTLSRFTYEEYIGIYSARLLGRAEKGAVLSEA